MVFRVPQRKRLLPKLGAACSFSTTPNFPCCVVYQMCTWCPRGKRGLQIPGTGYSCEQLSGLLEEQPILLTLEPSLQPFLFLLKGCILEDISSAPIGQTALSFPLDHIFFRLPLDFSSGHPPHQFPFGLLQAVCCFLGLFGILSKKSMISLEFTRLEPRGFECHSQLREEYTAQNPGW